MFDPHEFLTNTCYSYITILLLSFLQYHDSSWIFNENWGKASVDLKNILIKQKIKETAVKYISGTVGVVWYLVGGAGGEGAAEKILEQMASGLGLSPSNE